MLEESQHKMVRLGSLFDFERPELGFVLDLLNLTFMTKIESRNQIFLENLRSFFWDHFQAMSGHFCQETPKTDIQWGQIDRAH
jgi:hypothetical protein